MKFKVDISREAVFEQWVHALESGEYQQTQGYLRGDGGFCCLGVLCDVLAQNGGPKWRYNRYMKAEELLPEKVVDFIGMSEKQINKLMEMNDDENKSFEQIAKKVKKMSEKIL